MCIIIQDTRRRIVFTSSKDEKTIYWEHYLRTWNFATHETGETRLVAKGAKSYTGIVYLYKCLRINMIDISLCSRHPDRSIKDVRPRNYATSTQYKTAVSQQCSLDICYGVAWCVKHLLNSEKCFVFHTQESIKSMFFQIFLIFYLFNFFFHTFYF